MTDAPIQIRKLESVRAIRELAKQSGQTITDMVTTLVKAELDRRTAQGEEDYQRRLAAVREAGKAFRNLPIVGPLLTDDDLYDEDGLPK